jgi:hypothetical protein
VSVLDLDPTFFEEAADKLIEVGHTKGEYCKGGRRCALGILVEVAAERLGVEEAFTPTGFSDGMWSPDSEAYWHMKPYADELARTVGLGNEWDIPDWNDDPKRTRKQVVKAMRDTAARLRGDAE